MEKNQKDLVGYFSDFGRKIRKIFPKKRDKQKPIVAKTPDPAEIDKLPKGTTFSELMKVPPDKPVPFPSNSHGFSFGVVYANDLAKGEFEKEKPNFAVGSIIVREKNALASSETPETVIAMVKREKGFSAETGDWEFFVFNGADLKMQQRETKGDCAACHNRADQSDWVFRSYLK